LAFFFRRTKIEAQIETRCFDCCRQVPVERSIIMNKGSTILAFIRTFCLINNVGVDMVVDSRHVFVSHQGTIFEMMKGGQRRSIDNPGLLAQVQDLCEQLPVGWVRVLRVGQSQDDVRALRGDEFWFMIGGAFTKAKTHAAVQKRFLSHSWVIGKEVEEWLSCLTRPTVFAQLATGQTYTVTPQVQQLFTPKQLQFMLEQLGTVEVAESRTGPDYIIREFDSGRKTFGRTACVETTDNDDVFYAHVGGQNWGRFVRGRKSEHCSWLTVILRKQGDAYNVHRAYVGHIGEPFPGDPNERGDASRLFWATHALIDGSLPYREQTVTRDAPRYFTHPGVHAQRAQRGTTGGSRDATIDR
jgi:hypothetical protein